MMAVDATDLRWMRRALTLARRGWGRTSPNPMVGAVVVRADRPLGEGWHRRAGEPHAEVCALVAASQAGERVRGATLYVSLEPCSTQGRTPPCTRALLEAGIRRVVVGATDPNPLHAGTGFDVLRQAGVEVVVGVLEAEATRLNEAFNHWIVHGVPWVTAKAAMTLDGKIAAPDGHSRWITSRQAREHARRLRWGADAVLVGIGTVLADNPSLTARRGHDQRILVRKRPLYRIILDRRARTPPTARVASDPWHAWTILVVGQSAPPRRVADLAARVKVWRAPERRGRLDLAWLLRRLGEQDVTHLLVEGGGEVHGSFFEHGLVDRLVFYYAPKVLGGENARPAVGGKGLSGLGCGRRLLEPVWRRVGPDLVLTARTHGVSIWSGA